MTDNLAIWNAVSKTDPAHTKKVNQRGGFTAISAQYQILAATAQFGPIGIGWGYTSTVPILLDGVVTVGVTLWHGKRENTFGPVWGAADLKSSNGKLDSDAPKKAGTDGLTKALSQLGFNADVFLGRFDDNKYVEQVRAEFEGRSAPANDHSNGNGGGNGKDAPFPQGPAKNKTELKTLGRQFWREVLGCGDPDELDALVRSGAELTKQIAAALPEWWNGGMRDGEPYEGLSTVILKKQTELSIANPDWRQNPLIGG